MTNCIAWHHKPKKPFPSLSCSLVKIFYSNNRNGSRTEFKFILGLVVSFKIAMSKPSKTRAGFQLVECLNAYTKPQGSNSSIIWWRRSVISALKIRKSRLIWAT